MKRWKKGLAMAVSVVFMVSALLTSLWVTANPAPSSYAFIPSPNTDNTPVMTASPTAGLDVTFTRPGRGAGISTNNKIDVDGLYLEMALKNWDGVAGSTMWPEDNAHWDNYYLFTLRGEQLASGNGTDPGTNKGPGFLIRRAAADDGADKDGYAAVSFIPDVSAWAWWAKATNRTLIDLPRIGGTASRRLVVEVRGGNDIYINDTQVFGSAVTAGAFEIIGAQAYLNIGAVSEPGDTQAAEFTVVNAEAYEDPPDAERPVYAFEGAAGNAAEVLLAVNPSAGLDVTIPRPGRGVAVSSLDRITAADLSLDMILKHWDAPGDGMWPEDSSVIDNYYYIALSAKPSAGHNGIEGNTGPGLLIRRAAAAAGADKDGFAEVYFVPDVAQWAWWTSQTKAYVELPKIEGTTSRKLTVTVRDGNRICFGDTPVFDSDVTAASFAALGAQAYVNIGASSEADDTQAAEFTIVNGKAAAPPPVVAIPEAPVYSMEAAAGSDPAKLTIRNDNGHAVIDLQNADRDSGAIVTSAPVNLDNAQLRVLLNGWNDTGDLGSGAGKGGYMFSLFDKASGWLLHNESANAPKGLRLYVTRASATTANVALQVINDPALTSLPGVEGWPYIREIKTVSNVELADGGGVPRMDIALFGEGLYIGERRLATLEELDSAMSLLADDAYWSVGVNKEAADYSRSLAVLNAVKNPVLPAPLYQIKPGKNAGNHLSVTGNDGAAAIAFNGLSPLYTAVTAEPISLMNAQMNFIINNWDDLPAGAYVAVNYTANPDGQAAGSAALQVRLEKKADGTAAVTLWQTADGALIPVPGTAAEHVDLRVEQGGRRVGIALYDSGLYMDDRQLADAAVLRTILSALAEQDAYLSLGGYGYAGNVGMLVENAVPAPEGPVYRDEPDWEANTLSRREIGFTQNPDGTYDVRFDGVNRCNPMPSSSPRTPNSLVFYRHEADVLHTQVDLVLKNWAAGEPKARFPETADGGWYGLSIGDTLLQPFAAFDDMGNAKWSGFTVLLRRITGEYSEANKFQASVTLSYTDRGNQVTIGTVTVTLANDGGTDGGLRLSFTSRGLYINGSSLISSRSYPEFDRSALKYMAVGAHADGVEEINNTKVSEMTIVNVSPRKAAYLKLGQLPRPEEKPEDPDEGTGIIDPALRPGKEEPAGPDKPEKPDKPGDAVSTGAGSAPTALLAIAVASGLAVLWLRKKRGRPA